MNTATDTRDWTPPYIAFRTMTNLIQRLKDEGIPPQIDRSFLTGSEGGKTQVLNAFRSFDLIGPNGEVTPQLSELVNADVSKRKAIFRQLFEERYEEPVRLGTINATQMQLEDAFRTYGIGGDTLRKAVAFYLKGAEFAGIPVSKNFRTPQVKRAAGGTTKARTSAAGSAQQQSPQEPRAAAPADTMTVSVKTGLAGVLMQLPPNGPPWTEERREEFKKTFSTVLDFFYPLGEEHAYAEEIDEEDSEE
jgi:hypothetical protein